MNLLVNQKPVSVPVADTSTGLTLAQLLTHLGYTTGSIAVAVNGDFVPRSRYPLMKIEENQAVEVVAPMQGG